MSIGNHDGLRLSVTMTGQNADIHIVRVDGTIDTVTSPELDGVLASLVQQGRFRIILDMAGAQYVSSAGWGTFVSRLREIREGGGDLRLARMTPDVREIYDLLEFDGVLPHHDRLEGAQAAFNGGNGGNGGRHSERPVSSPVVTPPAPVAADRQAPLPCAPPEPVLATAESPIESAILQLVIEDPFYRLGEIKDRLSELGYRAVGRMKIWSILRRKKLSSRRQRFRYYRKAHSTSPTSLR